MNNYTLLVLAAGMGSRYGGLKQIDQLGPMGETIIDYSIYDALAAGFDKVVFVIRKSIEADFKEAIIDKYQNKIAVDYVLQEIDSLPKGFTAPADRTKPWGTAHAILMAKDKIDGFFAVINGDDFYGKNAFLSLTNYFKTLSLKDATDYSMVAYRLDKTLSDNGTVSRGVCSVDDNQNLIAVKEHTKLQAKEKRIINTDENGIEKELPTTAPVSMNFWGFHPSLFAHLEERFTAFLTKHLNDVKSEFYIPFVVDDLVKENKVKVKVLQTDAQWFGVTYRQDKDLVVSQLKQMTNEGIYPSPLWKR